MFYLYTTPEGKKVIGVMFDVKSLCYDSSFASRIFILNVLFVFDEIDDLWDSRTNLLLALTVDEINSAKKLRRYEKNPTLPEGFDYL